VFNVQLTVISVRYPKMCWLGEKYNSKSTGCQSGWNVIRQIQFTFLYVIYIMFVESTVVWNKMKWIKDPVTISLYNWFAH